MTTACADCSKCGKCYYKIRPCVVCGHMLNHATDMECPECHTPITEEMREAARAEYRQQKKEEFEWLFANARKKRNASQGKPQQQ